MAEKPDPYSRFYWRFIEEYPAVFDDKLAFGWWFTLLVIADQADPAPALLPRSCPKRTLDRLVTAGLVELGTGDRFRVKGVLAERERRREAARVGGLARHRSANAEQSFSKRLANAEQTVSLNETRRDEQRKDETRRGATGLAPIRNVLEEQGLIPKRSA